ncbi:hypothetical protein N7451_012742 [Penicillium sp. IBT 35674x]|nr:hypothetical protein N7451_012742 [Penicillium sp. IBT 35674x]
MIAASLDGKAIIALRESCSNLHNRLQRTFFKFNIEHQNSNLLHLAAETNNVSLAKAMLSYHADVNALFRGKTPIMRALKSGATDVLRVLLKTPGVEINLQNKALKSALWYAIKYSTCRAVTEMAHTHQNLNLDLRHEDGQTALHKAVWTGRIGLVQILLFLGSDPDAKDSHGHSPWDWACRSNRPSMMKTLTRGPDSRFPIDFDLAHHDKLPLHQSVSHGSMDAIRPLLTQKGSNLEAHDRHGNTPLHLAVHSGSREVMDLLLRHPRARVNCKDREGNTPLWLSTHLSCDAVTERLLEEPHVDINFIGGHGEFQAPSTSLHHAVLQPDTGALQRLLAVPGINVARCAAGQSPFALACAHGRVDAMKVLLHIDRVDVNASGLGHPPICQAVERGQLEAVRLLVQQGGRLQINRKTMTGHDTALCIAARDGSLDLVRALLHHDQIDPNLENRWCQGPLSLAAQRAHLNVVNALLLDGRLSRQSMIAALPIANSDPIRKLIRTKIGDLGVPKLRRSPRCRFGAFQTGQQ